MLRFYIEYSRFVSPSQILQTVSVKSGKADSPIKQTLPAKSLEVLKSEIDKNSLWGGLNIQKRELSIKGILAQDLGFMEVLFSGVSEDFRIRGDKGES